MKINLLIALCLMSPVVFAQITLQANIFASGFNAPVSIANCGDSRFFVVERAGRIIVLNSNGTKEAIPFLDIDSIVSDGNDERGLLGLSFDPNYFSNGFFYVYFIDNFGNSQIARYSRSASNPNVADANSKVIVISVTQPPGFTNHKGGNLVFGADGYLYCGLGDGGDEGDPLNNSQNGQSLLGKLIRIDVTTLPYTIPPSNPFIGTSSLDEIWATGLRNPWRFSFDRITNDMWISDVGAGQWEEINFQTSTSIGGENYGWRCYEGNAPYNTAGCGPSSGYDFPVYAYPHSGPNSGCSVTGGYVYRGTKYKSLYGIYLFSDYCSGSIWGLDANYNFTDYGTFGFGMSSFGEDMYGELYIANVASGNILSITTNECQPVAIITNPDTSYICNSPITVFGLEGSGLTYQWLRNNHPIPGANGPSYTPNVGSNYQLIVTNSSGCSDTSIAKIIINNKPDAVISGDNNFCFNQITSINANTGTGLSYQWQHKNIDIAGATQPSYDASLRGSYRVLVTNSQGCTRLANPFVVTGPPVGGLILIGSGTICQGESVEIISKSTGSNYNYQWSNNNVPISGANNQSYFANTSGFYRMTVSNQFGCTITGSGKLVNVINCDKTVSNNEWTNFDIFTIEGKLLFRGKIPAMEFDFSRYFNENYEVLDGLYIVNLYDVNYTERKILKLMF